MTDRQLRGIALLLFSIAILIYAILDPWIIISLSSDFVGSVGLVCAIAGLALVFKKGE